MSIKTIDIAWLGGLLEGEGYFYLHDNHYPSIRLGMTDEDTVIKAAILMGSTVYSYKNTWITKVSSVRAIQWMFMLYPFLGERRRSRVANVLQYWREHTYSYAPRGSNISAVCHPDKLATGSDLLCYTCYHKRNNRRRYLKKKTLLLEKVG